MNYSLNKLFLSQLPGSISYILLSSNFALLSYFHLIIIREMMLPVDFYSYSVELTTSFIRWQ